MYIYTYAYTLLLTHPLTQSQLVECMLHEHSLGFHSFSAIVKVGSESIYLILSGMSSHILGSLMIMTRLLYILILQVWHKTFPCS